MAQKDKVKELVGRSLGSYHTKSLQQIDRIERKNKEQNHKINILTNELDNDYLTKTEEGSVISLEHSKEGMVYLDRIEGNTLVNYCTDGAKELTLNGDIDVEGTNVTITEGVDNGKVDVMCEGNTLVNMFSGKISDLYGGNYRKEEDGYITLVKKTYGDCIHLKTDMYKPSTTYTLIVDVKENTLSSVANLIADSRTYVKSAQGNIGVGQTGIFKIKFTTIDDFSTTTNNSRWGFYLSYAQLNEETRGNITLKFILLEGDWTNKEIPSYFEGMKSVGECENNKFEILSTNQNLYSENEFLSPLLPKEIINNKEYYVLKGINTITDNNLLIDDTMFKFKENTRYTFTIKGMRLDYFHIFYVTYTDGTRSSIKYDNIEETEMTFTTLENKTIKNVFTDTGNIGAKSYILVNGICMKEGTDSTFVPRKSNKKEISLNEPLRGLPNGVCDKFVKQGGKWYVERNCGEIILNGSENWMIRSESSNDGALAYYHIVDSGLLGNSEYYISDLFNYYGKVRDLYAEVKSEGIARYISINHFYITILKTRLTSVDVNGLKQWLLENPITVVCQLATPTYEEITDVELITYLDTTHISNNSTIPCNMKIQNSGYNAIIKPSTKYTVALDTNKSGTIGINLGGAKVTTNNNVATITTPATLTDDSLRLYGKDIKASKVRLLEGDKTNWIPSYFEGMESSFEDKLQDDGTYKMEILSCNENLFNNDFNKRFENGDYVKSSPYIYFPVNVNKNKNYTCYIDAKDLPLDAYCNIATRTYYDYPLFTTVFNATTEPNLTVTRTVSRTTLNNCNNKIYISLAFNKGNMQQVEEYLKSGKFKVKVVEQGNNLSFIPHKSNKIQFSSIQPLRGVGNIKDRFAFKDGKLMIERNCGVGVLNGNENWAKHSITDDDLRKNVFVGAYWSKAPVHDAGSGSLIANNVIVRHDTIKTRSFYIISKTFILVIDNKELSTRSVEGLKEWLRNNPITYVYKKDEPTYEEIPFELQKIILEGYENGTLFIDTNIPPTVTTTYAGETPIAKSVRLNKTEVSNNTTDINDNIVPYLMDMDYRVVCLQLEGGIENVSMARLFGGTFEMLQRDILSKRYSIDEYRYRLDAYLSANKITEDEYNKLGDMLND